MHAVERRNQHFRKEKIKIVVSNLHALVKRERERERQTDRQTDRNEIRAIYGAGNYIISPSYQRFKAQSHIWRSWTKD